MKQDIDDNQNPWAGLASYEDPETAKRKLKFCGRDDDSYDFARLIMGNIFVTLYGKSGIGKTSLLNAGVFPELREELYSPASIRLGMRDEKHPQSYQTMIVETVERIVKRTETINVIEEQLDQQSIDYLWNYFARHRFYDKHNEQTTPVIVFDQFEEVFRGNRYEAETLLRQLDYLNDKDHTLDSCHLDGLFYRYEQNFRFVISIREDDLYRLEDSIDNCYLPALKRCRYRLRSLSEKGAHDAILVPGEGLFNPSEKNSIAEAIISKSRNEDDSISTNIISLLCSRIYIDFKKSGADHISPLLVEDFIKVNPFERFYYEVTQGFSNKEKSYIEEHFVDSTSRRNSIPESDFLLHVKNGTKLLEGKNRILQRVSTSSDGKNNRVELIHDSFCEPLAVLKKKREQRRKVMAYAVSAAVVLLFVGVSALIALIFTQKGTISQGEKDLEARTIELEATNAQLEATNAQLERKNEEIEAERKATLLAYQEKVKAFSKLELANKEILKQKQELDDNVRMLTYANWSIKENQARFVAEKANALVNSDSYFARLLSINVLPEDLENPSIPFVSEAEIALRNSSYAGTTTLCGHTMQVNSLEFSQDGNYLLSASSDNTIKIWASSTGKLLKSFNGDNGPVDYASFSSDNKKIVSVARNKIFVWDVTTASIIDSLSTTARIAFFDKSDENVIAINEEYIDVWNMGGRVRLSHIKLDWPFPYDEFGFTIHPRDVVSISYDKSEVIFKSYYHGNYSFDIQSGKRKEYHNRLAFCQAAHVIYDKDTKHHYIVDAETQTKVKELPSEIKMMVFDIKGDKLAATSEDYSIVLWNTDLSNIYFGHKNDVYSAVFSSDGKHILSSSKDSTICIRDTKTHEVVNKMKNDGDYSSVAFYYPNEKSIISASHDNNICIWTPKEDGYSVKMLQRHNNMVMDAHVSPDGRWILSTAGDSSFTVGDASGERIYYRIKFKQEQVSCGAFSPDSKQFAVSVIGWIFVFETESCEMIKSFPVHRKSATGLTQSYAVNSICYSPDGNYIVTSSSDKTAAIWDVRTGELVRYLAGHTESVKCANYSPSGDYIVTASSDGTVKVWKSNIGLEIASIKGHLGGVEYAAFSSDGNKIVSASDDRTIRIWEFPPLQDLIDETRKRFKDRELTPEERRKYYLE